MAKVSDAVLHTMIPGQNPLVMKSEGVSIGISKQTPGTLAGYSVGMGGEGQFALPQDSTLINVTKDNSYITTTVSRMSFEIARLLRSSSLEMWLVLIALVYEILVNM